MDETEVIYGTIGTVPMGEFDPEVKYELLNLVSYDGSSYVVHTDPPVGTLPTDTNYWQLSAQGTSKATVSTPGTVKPDGVTTEVDSNGTLSVKTATQTAAGIVKGSAGIKVGEDGSIDVNTIFEQAAELANIIAGEAIASALGKIAKSIAVTMGLNENALLKNMLTNMDTNDQNKIPTSAFVHKLCERIGMGEDLDIGDNLTAGLNELNSNLTSLTGKFTLETGAQKFVAGYDIANDTVYIQVHVGSGKIYQLAINSNNIKYAKVDNGTWTTLWTK
ncbi:hypothetical protein [Lacrimispora sp. JR3]|uniref:hypothetical protein n=1 Tax=Lacrimispora sinapis TaxID=3111456 RepID=UPI0037499ABC